jgi:hypothetical protein
MLEIRKLINVYAVGYCARITSVVDSDKEMQILQEIVSRCSCRRSCPSMMIVYSFFSSFALLLKKSLMPSLNFSHGFRFKWLLSCR